MVASLSPPRKTAWSGISSEGLDIYWSTCKGKGFLIKSLMVVTSGMIRQLGYGVAKARVGCFFIELTGAGVSDARVSCCYVLPCVIFKAIPSFC